MPELSLTDFVDVVSKSGTPKATKITQIKNRPPYEPAFDFYKTLRDRIIEVHSQNLPKPSIRTIITTLTDPKKRQNYPLLVRGYQRWWGRNNLVWFSPPNGLFSRGSVNVKVNPELGLEINGNPYLIKLYFKSEPLSKMRIDVIVQLMTDVLSTNCPPNTRMAVLDVRNYRLMTQTASSSILRAILIAEIAYIATLWPQV